MAEPLTATQLATSQIVAKALIQILRKLGNLIISLTISQLRHDMTDAPLPFYPHRGHNRTDDLLPFLSDEVVQELTETDYTVHHNPPFTMNIGEACPGLQKLMADRNALSAAFITPFDLFRYLREGQKLVCLLCLKAYLRRRRLSYIDAIGISQHASKNARGDAGVLILAMEMDAAKSLSRHYEQHVFVWAASDGVPELVQPFNEDIINIA